MQFPARGQSCPQQRTKTKRPPTAHQHARTRLDLSPSLDLRTLLRVETRAPPLMQFPARGQSCPQQRTKNQAAVHSSPARAHTPWPFAPLLPFGRCCGLKPALRSCRLRTRSTPSRKFGRSARISPDRTHLPGMKGSDARCACGRAQGDADVFAVRLDDARVARTIVDKKFHHGFVEKDVQL